MPRVAPERNAGYNSRCRQNVCLNSWCRRPESGWQQDVLRPESFDRNEWTAVTRIFLVLSTIANASLLAAFAFGWRIGDIHSVSDAVRDASTLHFLTALGAALLAILVHAVAMTYFMGTGRWIEETSLAYRLGDEGHAANVRLKYRVIPGAVLCFALLLATGSFGAIADPASHVDVPYSATIHFTLAVTTLAVNLLVSWVEWSNIARNGRLVEAIVEEVRRIRREKGLDPSPTAAPAVVPPR